MLFEVEHIVTNTADVDVDKLIEAFAAEWEEFLDGDEPDDFLKQEFLLETAYEMGRDIFDDEWVVKYGYSSSEFDIRKIDNG